MYVLKTDSSLIGTLFTPVREEMSLDLQRVTRGDHNRSLALDALHFTFLQNFSNIETLRPFYSPFRSLEC